MPYHNLFNRMLPGIFLFKLGHANWPVKARADWRAFDAVARRLDRSGGRRAGKEGMNSARGFLALGHGVDNFRAAVRAVAPGEHTRNVRLTRVGIAHHHAAFI